MKYEEKKPSNKATKAWVIVILAPFVITGIFGIVDRFDKIKPKEHVCDFRMPKEYKLMTNGKYFIVCRGKAKDYYEDNYMFVWEYSGGTSLFPLSIKTPTKFIDSCEAKEKLKEYLESKYLYGYK